MGLLCDFRNIGDDFCRKRLKRALFSWRPKEDGEVLQSMRCGLKQAIYRSAYVSLRKKAGMTCGDAKVTDGVHVESLR
jgi:hypothetical protein